MPLAFDRCAGCGYHLQGLPVEGACPECGGRFDRREIVLLGWTTGATGHWLTWSWPTAILVGVAFGWFGFDTLRKAYEEPGYGTFILAGIWVFVLWQYGSGMLKRVLGSRSHTIVLRFSDRGFVQVLAGDDACDVPLTPWSECRTIVVKAGRGETARIKMTDRKVTVMDARAPCPSDQVNALRELLVTLKARNEFAF